MMFAIYRLSDGVVIGHKACPPSQIARNTPAGCAAIEGTVDAAAHRIDPETRALVARETAPIDLGGHIADLARETIARIEAGQVRTIREALLGDSAAIERLREQEPAIAAARATIQRSVTDKK
jgi:hypothetical protein